MTPELINALTGTSTVLGLLALVAYLFLASQVRRAERSVRQVLAGDALISPEQVIDILKTFKDEANRLEALRTLTAYDARKARDILTKVEANVDVNKLNNRAHATQVTLALISAVAFLGLAAMGLGYGVYERATGETRHQDHKEAPALTPEPPPQPTPPANDVQPDASVDGHLPPPSDKTADTIAPNHTLDSPTPPPSEAHDQSRAQLELLLVGRWEAKSLETEEDEKLSGCAVLVDRQTQMEIFEAAETVDDLRGDLSSTTVRTVKLRVSSNQASETLSKNCNQSQMGAPSKSRNTTIYEGIMSIAPSKTKPRLANVKLSPRSCRVDGDECTEEDYYLDATGTLRVISDTEINIDGIVFRKL